MSEKLCVHCQKPVGRGTRNTQHGYLHDECWDEYFASYENSSDGLSSESDESDESDEPIEPIEQSEKTTAQKARKGCGVIAIVLIFVVVLGAFMLLKGFGSALDSFQDNVLCRVSSGNCK